MRAAQQVALTASMLGAKPEWPDLDECLARFDEWLNAEPKQVGAADAADLALRDALGLRRPGG